jgi:hypothetical protein
VKAGKALTAIFEATLYPEKDTKVLLPTRKRCIIKQNTLLV